MKLFFLRVAGLFFASAALTGSAAARPIVFVDTPRSGTTVAASFDISGWAVDRASATSPGVNAIHVWAYPDGSPSAVFLGYSYVNGARGDVAHHFNAPQFSRSGFRLRTKPLPPGGYTVVLYPFSTVINAFDFRAIVGVRVTVPSPRSTSGAVKFLDWNIHHGIGTDGRCDLNSVAYWIARSGANVVSLNEVEKRSGWCGNADQPAEIVSLLRAKTGQTWYSHFAQRDGRSTGQGNLLLSTFPIESQDTKLLSHSRSVGRIAFIVNGIRVNAFSTHLDAESSNRRAQQMAELNGWAATIPEQRIVAGDFNAWPGAWEIGNMTRGHVDSWAAARSAGDAVGEGGNTSGNTRRSRIDYVFYSKGASRLRLVGVRVFDTRDSSGDMPSDHRPMLATFDVR